MIRLSAESSAFFQGSGWRSYDNYIGARILYSTYSSEIRQDIMSSPRIKHVIQKMAAINVRSAGILPPASLPEEEEDWLRLTEKLKKKLGLQRAKQERLYQRALNEQTLNLSKSAGKIVQDLVAVLDSKLVVRFVAFIVNNILVRMYNQGIHIKESEFLEVEGGPLLDS
jgi:hypothetical protein